MEMSKPQKIVALSAIGLFRQVNKMNKIPVDLRARFDAIGKWFTDETNCPHSMVAGTSERAMYEMLAFICEAIIAAEEPANPTDDGTIRIVA